MLNVKFSNEIEGAIPKIVNDYILLGGSTLRTLDLPVTPLIRPSVGTHNIASTVLERSNMTDSEREAFYRRSLKARLTLRDEVKEYERHFAELKNELEKKCLDFVQALKKIQCMILEKYPPKYDGAITYLSDLDVWFMSSLYTHSEDVHIMLAKYLGFEYCYLYGREIYKKGLKEANKDRNIELKQPNKEWQYDSEGLEIISIKPITAEDYVEFHVWLLYEDMFDIDALHGYLSRYINENLPEILITKGEGLGPRGEMGGMKQKLVDNGFVCEDIKLSRINKEKFIWNFERSNGLLDRIYEMVISNIGD